METAVLTKEQALVKEIHDAFDNESDALYLLATERDAEVKKEMSEKRDRIRMLGFVNCEEINRLKPLGKEGMMYEFARKYRKKYPYLKFITDLQVNDICHRYNLTTKKPSEYTGSIPDGKLSEIEQGIVEIEISDLLDNTFEYTIGDTPEEREKRIREMKMKLNPATFDSELMMYEMYESYKVFFESQKPLSEKDVIEKIKETRCLSDFHQKEIKKVIKKIDRSKLVIVERQSILKIKNAVVLQPVKGGYLIISKWGLEANDPELTVPENN
jgi:hypothetical protein